MFKCDGPSGVRFTSQNYIPLNASTAKIGTDGILQLLHSYMPGTKLPETIACLGIRGLVVSGDGHIRFERQLGLVLDHYDQVVW